MKKTYNIYFKSLVGIATIIGLGILLLNRSAKTKQDFIEISGSIHYLDQEYQNLPIRNKGKYKYLVIDGTERVFEIFVGTDPGDFSPKLSRIDELTVGDTVKLYYDDNSYTRGELVNSLTRFIDKSGEPYFIENSGTDKTLGFVVLALGGILLIVVFTLKFAGRIY
ncbi:MAG: hypothetical protein RIC35_09490 [Marinoscillum sp.]